MATAAEREEALIRAVSAAMETMHNSARQFPFLHPTSDGDVICRAEDLANRFRAGFEMASEAVNDTAPWHQQTEVEKELIETTQAALCQLERTMATMFASIDHASDPLP